MVTPQEWLEKKYSDKENTTEILFSEDLTLDQGELIISDYFKLEKIGKIAWKDCVKNITKLIISNCQQLKEINITDFVDNKSLLIDNCPQLERLYCRKNQLTNLDLSKCSNLTTIYYYNNQLTITDFLATIPHPEKLTKLDIINSEFLAPELAFLTPFINLRILWLSDTNFTGSLQSLTPLTNLRVLNISNTKIDSGLEYLPKSLTKLYCWGTKFEVELTNYKFYEDYYDYQAWRRDYNSQQIKLLKEEVSKLSSLENEVTRLTNLIKEQKDKIINAYTHFFSEKELLQQLITAHLEYRKAPKEGKSKLKKHKEKLWNELEEKVSEELMDEVETILEDCEQLIHYEKELQYQITHHQKLIAVSQQTIQQITYNINNLNLNQGHALIGNTTIGDQADLSFKLQEVLESKIEVLPNSRN